MAVMVGLQHQLELPLAPIPNPPKRRVLCWRRKKGAVRSDPSVSVAPLQLLDVDDVAFAPNPPPPLKPQRRVLCWRRKKGAVRSDPSAAKPRVVITISSDEEEGDEEDRYPRINRPVVVHILSSDSDSDSDDDSLTANPSSSNRGGGCCKSQRVSVSDPSSLTAKTIGSRSSSRTTATAAAEYEYAADIHDNLRSMEVETKMKRWPLAKEVVPIRAALVDWLVAVGEHYHLQSDTLFLACSYFDRFLFSNALDPEELQLLSISCMLLATKYEEKRHSLDVQGFLYSLLTSAAADGFCYCKEQVLKMETRVVKSLNYQMASPTVKSFVNTFLAAAVHLDVLHVEVELTHYLAELTLLDHGCNRFLPSLVAASALFVSRLTSHPEIHPWTSTLQHHTGYTPSDLKDCIFAIHDLQTNIKHCSTLMAITEKYQIVAMLFPPLPIIPAAYLD